jgi:uncharacterized protein YjiS (DUF1127 family)
MFERLMNRYARWRLYRETLFQLQRVDRRILNDAGIEPQDIKCWALEGARERIPEI